MARQYFRTLREPINSAGFAAVTGVVAETALWPTSPWTAWAANELTPGQAWKLTAGGVITTALTPGNLTITPRVGTTTGGAQLGASLATALTASLTAVPFSLEMWLAIRTIGTGTSASAVATGTFTSRVIGNTPAGAASVVPFGGTIATFDSTAGQGIFIGWTPGATTVSVQPLYVLLESMN
jgi:hypothetical protein